MKKLFLTLALILTLVFAFAACDGGGNGGNTGDTSGGDNNPHIHSYGEWIVEKEPKKDEDGLKYTECTVCGERGSEEVIPMTGSVGLDYTINIDENGQYYSVTGIGSCTDTKIIIPAIVSGFQVKAIAEGAFEACNNITEIVIPNTITTVGDFAFSCSDLASVIFGENSQLTSIGECAFENCNITSISIPSSVTSIGDFAFYSCFSLTSIIVDTDNSNYMSIDGNLYTKDGRTLIQYATGKKETSLNIPSGVTSISESAFSYCANLTSITFGENSQLTSISSYAFDRCYSLTSITLPSSVTSIGDYAFNSCDSLTSITFGGTKAQWERVSKGSGWASCTPDITVTCTDGVYSTKY